MNSEAMDAEFDTLASWTADVAVDLGPDYYVPAGCRGSGSPAALDWLLRELRPDAASRMLDCGAGVGGPAGYAREQTSVRPVLAEPEPGACRAARRLFDLPVTRADAAALPFADGVFDQAWSLGVLCTTDRQSALLGELRRVVRPDGLIGLLVFVASTDYLPDEPEGNEFPTQDSLHAMLDGAGLGVVASTALGELDAPPAQWRRRTAAVEAALEARHHRDAAWRTSQEQQDALQGLFGSGRVRGQLLSLRGTDVE